MIFAPVTVKLPRRGAGRSTELPRVARARARPLTKTAIQAGPAVKLARRDRLVLEHQWLVRSIAVVMLEKLPVHLESDDLMQAGLLGLIDAADKFDHTKQPVFTCYARHRIKGAMLDGLRRLDWASRGVRTRQKQVENAKRDLKSTFHRDPTDAEVAERLGLNLTRYRKVVLDLRNAGPISADTGGDREDLPALDFPSKPESQPDFICIQKQLRNVLGNLVKTLPARYREVVTLYYTKELSMLEISGKLGINESRVSQIHKSALKRMAIQLHYNGIESPRAF
jgi:RNA polymerase sigma factor for flagellar operon FliA